MYHLTQKLDSINECIKRGEKVRILYEIILSELGMGFENTGQEVFKKLMETQDEYYESVQLLKTIIESGQRANPDENEEEIEKTDKGVSVSN